MYLFFTTNRVQNASRGQMYRQWPKTVNSLTTTHHVKEKRNVRTLNVFMSFIYLFLTNSQQVASINAMTQCHMADGKCPGHIQMQTKHSFACLVLNAVIEDVQPSNIVLKFLFSLFLLKKYTVICSVENKLPVNCITQSHNCEHMAEFGMGKNLPVFKVIINNIYHIFSLLFGCWLSWDVISFKF